MTSASLDRILSGMCVIALATVLTACTGDDPGDPTSSGPSGSSSAPAPKTLGSLADSVLDAPTSDPLAEQNGTVPQSKGASVAAKVSVASLNRGSASTVLLLKLSSTETIRPAGGFLSADEAGGSANGIHLTVGKQDLYPGTFTYGNAVLAKNCVCTGQVRQLGPEGLWVSAAFEQVPEGTTSAALTVPGFETFDVPVTSVTPIP